MEEALLSSPSLESFRKLDQIIQNFHIKAASLVLESRLNLSPLSPDAQSGIKRINKWFQLDTHEFEDFRDELRLWKHCSALDQTIPPLILETFLDTSHLAIGQCLVLVDNRGRSWEVKDSINSSGASLRHENGPGSNIVVLERWRFELRPAEMPALDDFGIILPTIYKKMIVFFRSLFVTARVIPPWKVARQGRLKGAHPVLFPRCRIRSIGSDCEMLKSFSNHIDGGPGDVATDYFFGDLEIPVGRLVASVTYRNECNFHIEDSEAFLSSRFTGLNEEFFGPSAPRLPNNRQLSLGPGSLPSHHGQWPGGGIPEQQQTYGSLSTFHGQGHIGTSPISALKAVQIAGSDTSSLPENAIDDGASTLLQPPTQDGRAVLRGPPTGLRRPSVSFQPFKAGAISGSPVPKVLDIDSPSFALKTTRAPVPVSGGPTRSRQSITFGTPTLMRGEPLIGSIKPSSTSRYSSSFGHRKGRSSLGLPGRHSEEEQWSSGRQSVSSSVTHPSSGAMNEGGTVSSGSLPADDDQISDFLKALDYKKNLKSFEPANKGESATNRTVARLSKFYAMREMNDALMDSMASSLLVNQPLSSSSQQPFGLSSITTSPSVLKPSSADKLVSPQTSHIPATPSRLSENAIIHYGSTGRGPESVSTNTATDDLKRVCRDDILPYKGSSAIDIPLSPTFGINPYRSSSLAPMEQHLLDDHQSEVTFEPNRSLSLGAGELDSPALSNHPHGPSEKTLSHRSLSGSRGSMNLARRDVLDARKSPVDFVSAAPSSPFGRRRYMSGTAGIGVSRSRGGSRLTGKGTGSIGRHARVENEFMDEEPLVFDMSEMDAQGRRSLEEQGTGAVMYGKPET